MSLGPLRLDGDGDTQPRHRIVDLLVVEIDLCLHQKRSGALRLLREEFVQIFLHLRLTLQQLRKGQT